MESVLPENFYELAAPASLTTPRLARQFVSGTLEATGHSALIDDACVCVSDAVTNVVQHARVPTVAVEVTVHGRDRATIAVRDGDPVRRPYRRGPARPDDERGRGLALVRDLSHASGVSLIWDGLDVVGKRVWFELRAP
ncbi:MULTISPECIES: ATP-binding protein [Streptomyces]|uniref:ATP-binding protein n=1 Tax=Streptomyces luteosporeus TaxID=173856 RepID=A0ABP6G5H4_9ACTN